MDKGVRNVEILKQPQYTPYKVEDQIAIIYCGTKGLLQKVPVRSIKDFEVEFLNNMNEHHADVMADLKAGKISDEIMSTLSSVCQEVSKKYEK